MSKKDKITVEVRPAGESHVTVYVDSYCTHHEYILTNAEYDEWREAFGYEV